MLHNFTMYCSIRAAFYARNREIDIFKFLLLPTFSVAFYSTLRLALHNSLACLHGIHNFVFHMQHMFHRHTNL